MATKKHEKEPENGLIAVIRISGDVKLKPDVRETLDRLRLRRKFVTILVDRKNKPLMGMLNVVKYMTAFGEISPETLEKLIKARGQKTDKKKFNEKEVADDLLNGKNLEDIGFKPFFRMHPPRGGIKSKLQYPQGVLGNNRKDINKLIERML